MTRAWRSKKPSGSAKKWGTVTSAPEGTPARSVTRMTRLASWTTSSGPTAMVELAGSVVGLTWSLAARPAKPAVWLSGAAIRTNGVGAGAAVGRIAGWEGAAGGSAPAPVRTLEAPAPVRDRADGIPLAGPLA